MDIEKIKDAEQKIKEIYGDVKVEFDSICGIEYYLCHLDTDFGKFKFYINQGRWYKPCRVELDYEPDDYLNNLKVLKKLRRKNR